MVNQTHGLRQFIINLIAKKRLTFQTLQEGFKLAGEQRVLEELEKNWTKIKTVIPEVEGGKYDSYDGSFEGDEHRLLFSSYKCKPKPHAYEEFMRYVGAGHPPPPHVMAEMYRFFNTYTESRGDLSLDEAFFGRKHNKRHSIPYRNLEGIEYSDFHYRVKLNNHEPKEYRATIRALAENHLLYKNQLRVAAGDEEIDVESFLKGYRRWKERQSSG